MSFHDISERKEHEREKLKIQKLESIGLLAGGIAHDFNNILAALYGNIALAKLKVTKEQPGFRYIEAAANSMNSATLLTNQLLTFAKGGDPVKNDLSLVHLIEEVVAFHLSGSNVKPDILYPDNLWLADAEQGQIQQAFANLTINAMHAMPDGGTLRVELENMALRSGVIATVKSGKYIRIRFCDEGIGIAPEHLSRIFDPYFTTKQSGSGLGLATIYSIITKHGGQITVESQLNKGTTFTLYLPATLSRRPLQTTSTQSTICHHMIGKILLMDDEESIRHTISSMLNELNFTVETAKNETEAVNLYHQALTTESPFDLVILDMTIPGGKGGKEVARSILKLNPAAKLIVSSGYADAPVMANYGEYGFKGVIPKPYDLEKLSTVMAQVLSE
ncbi:MAG: ATP-binding protein [Geopsychrobacter sp.]|nr:ATP-binding protein [Geopsychrobacter sp.]